MDYRRRRSRALPASAERDSRSRRARSAGNVEPGESDDTFLTSRPCRSRRRPGMPTTALSISTIAPQRCEPDVFTNYATTARLQRHRDHRTKRMTTAADAGRYTFSHSRVKAQRPNPPTTCSCPRAARWADPTSLDRSVTAPSSKLTAPLPAWGRSVCRQPERAECAAYAADHGRADRGLQQHRQRRAARSFAAARSVGDSRLQARASARAVEVAVYFNNVTNAIVLDARTRAALNFARTAIERRHHRAAVRITAQFLLRTRNSRSTRLPF